MPGAFFSLSHPTSAVSEPRRTPVPPRGPAGQSAPELAELDEQRQAIGERRWKSLAEYYVGRLDVRRRTAPSHASHTSHRQNVDLPDPGSPETYSEPSPTRSSRSCDRSVPLCQSWRFPSEPKAAPSSVGAASTERVVVSGT